MAEEGLICSIDLQFTSETAEDWFVVTTCGHTFHNSCLQDWLSRGNEKCPMCNKHIGKSSELRRIHGINPSNKVQEIPAEAVDANNALNCVSLNLEDLALSRQTPDFNFTIVVLGAVAVGKSSLIKRFASGTFQYNVTTTIGADVAFKYILVGGKLIKLTIWDTSGQERFRAVSHNFGRNAHGALIVYSYDSPQSVVDVPYWIEFLKICSCNENGPAMLLVGNKMDLKNKAVRSEIGSNLAKQNHISLFETSAKDDMNVDAVFRALAVETLMKIELNKIQYMRKEQKVTDDAPVPLAVVNVSTSVDTRQRNRSCC